MDESPPIRRPPRTFTQSCSVDDRRDECHPGHDVHRRKRSGGRGVGGIMSMPPQTPKGFSLLLTVVSNEERSKLSQ
jgi:hypothetical protein